MTIKEVNFSWNTTDYYTQYPAETVGNNYFITYGNICFFQCYIKCLQTRNEGFPEAQTIITGIPASKYQLRLSPVHPWFQDASSIKKPFLLTMDKGTSLLKANFGIINYGYMCRGWYIIDA